MSQTLKIPTCNVLMGGDYTAAITLGCGDTTTTANVVLDTGSSTLAVQASKFRHVDARPTPYVQFVGYGTGSWAGPVCSVAVGMGTGDHRVELPEVYCAQIESGSMPSSSAPMFSPADGIMGLAYGNLDEAANVGGASSHYPLAKYATAQAFGVLPNIETLTPYFTQLETAGVVPNAFAFWTKRSMTDYSKPDPKDNPVNQGWFVLGDGEQHTELYQGGFQAAKVIGDAYYNTQLLTVQVGDGDRIEVPSLQQIGVAVGRTGWSPQVVQAYRQTLEESVSNSIIDSGTNGMTLMDGVFQALLEELGKHDPKFAQMARSQVAPLTTEDLDAWPAITLVLAGADGQDVSLVMKPQTYWQVDAFAEPRYAGMASFAISSAGAWQGNIPSPQSILGLPAMNDRYTVFDRSAGAGRGVVKFATLR
ncbi:MAG: A1 family peptidase [Deltaproteobacteria bacterium]|nr:A1 family peptidase [Deltaproteobacteria bacterium]